MRTYSHAFFTWLLARYGFRASRKASLAGAAGAALPDVPAAAAVAYQALIQRSLPRPGMPHDELHEKFLDAAYESGLFAETGLFFHSTIPVGILLALHFVLRRLGRRHGGGVLLWFLLGWLGHVLADFFTHAEDARPLFWPLSSWLWQSPVSYWNPDRYGSEFFFAEHALILLGVLWIVFQSVRQRRVG
jgi:hypothetical protein